MNVQFSTHAPCNMQSQSTGRFTVHQLIWNKRKCYWSWATNKQQYFCYHPEKRCEFSAMSMSSTTFFSLIPSSDHFFFINHLWLLIHRITPLIIFWLRPRMYVFMCDSWFALAYDHQRRCMKQIKREKKLCSPAERRYLPRIKFRRNDVVLDAVR